MLRIVFAAAAVVPLCNSEAVQRGAQDLSATFPTGSSEGYTWPGGVVRYWVDRPSFRRGLGWLQNWERQLQGNFEEAIKEWESTTCIRFVDCETDEKCKAEGGYYYKVSYRSGMCGATGQHRSSGFGDMFLDQFCNAGGITHEFGHAIGLMHEHQRPDRDEHVWIEKSAINNNYGNLAKRYWKNGARCIGPYDYRSLMHYVNDIEAPVTLRTINKPSPVDIASVKFLYNNCKAEYKKPVCIASKAETSEVPAGLLWTIEFNAKYSQSMKVETTTNAPQDRITELESRLNKDGNIGKDGNVVLAFNPSPDQVGKTFKFDAVFTAKDGKKATCGVSVKVIPARPVVDRGCITCTDCATVQGCGQCYNSGIDHMKSYGCLTLEFDE